VTARDDDTTLAEVLRARYREWMRDPASGAYRRAPVAEVAAALLASAEREDA
jgi:hypothetical protein